MNLLVHSATRQDEKLSLWTSIPLAWVNNAAFLSSLDMISVAPIKWLYIHAVTFLFSYKPSALGLHRFSYLEKHTGGLPAINLILNITFQWRHFIFQTQIRKTFNILYCLSFLITNDIWIYDMCQIQLDVIWMFLQQTAHSVIFANQSLRCHIVPLSWVYKC